MNATARPTDMLLEQISLQVQDRDAMLRFYTTQLGMDLLQSDGQRDVFGFGAGEPVLELVANTRAMSRPANAPGLFHVAYLYPSRQALARALYRIAGSGWPLQGGADHGVSEAIYLADPEGNGIELYVDRPRTEWPTREGKLEMVTEPLDLQALVAEACGTDTNPVGTRIGHIHLQVSSLEAAEEFWCNVIGLEATQRSYPGALFVSAGGYHHHLGLNTWRSRGASLPEGIWTGLRSITFSIPDVRESSALESRLHAFYAIATRTDGRMTVRFESTDVSIPSLTHQQV